MQVCGAGVDTVRRRGGLGPHDSTCVRFISRRRLTEAMAALATARAERTPWRAPGRNQLQPRRARSYYGACWRAQIDLGLI